MIFPTRHPVIMKFFEKEFIVMVLSLIPGIHIKGMKSFSKLYEVYMSSAMTMTMMKSSSVRIWHMPRLTVRRFPVRSIRKSSAS